MVSHRAGIGLSATPVRGVHAFFKKRNSAYNVCVKKHLTGLKGKSRSQIKDAFTAAAHSCAGTRKA